MSDRDSTAAASGRLGFVDDLRGLAATVIALHHIGTYGPLPYRAAEVVPRLMDWIFEYGRMAVQIFLVISGFVTALVLARAPISLPGFARFALRRYVRLGFPCLATLLYVLALWALIPRGRAAFPLFDAVDGRTLLANAFFLQDILGYPSLSAGLWYLAIDFQFGLVFYGMLLLHRGLTRALGVRSPRLDAAWLVALSAPWALLSVFVWNLDAAQEVWVWYFLGALYLGVVGAWGLAGRVPGWVFWAYAGAVALGLAVAWRERLALALATGVLIYIIGRAGRLDGRASRSPLRGLGRISYSLFLVHYPTTWAVESLGLRFWDKSLATALLGMATSFVASLAAAVVFYRLVERPSLRLAERLRPGQA
jgi:peptidoglycan/LPS O-acetylase OafA/YrhL